MSAWERARIKRGQYTQTSVSQRIEAFFLDNLGKLATRKQVQEAARDPRTGSIPENWHQRLSELRTDKGYTILSSRDRVGLKPAEYVMPSAKRRSTARARVRPSPTTWASVLAKAGCACEWKDPDGSRCGLKEGDLDPIGGGSVRLTPDHKDPHSNNPTSDPNDTEAWQVLCPRHQVTKRNFWDDRTGKLNVQAIVQAASVREKRAVYTFLKSYFGDS